MNLITRFALIAFAVGIISSPLVASANFGFGGGGGDAVGSLPNKKCHTTSNSITGPIGTGQVPPCPQPLTHDGSGVTATNTGNLDQPSGGATTEDPLIAATDDSLKEEGR